MVSRGFKGLASINVIKNNSLVGSGNASMVLGML